MQGLVPLGIMALVVYLIGRRKYDTADSLNDSMGLAGDVRTVEERTDNEGGW